MRKVKKDKIAQAMARRRWIGKTKEERLATSRHASEARSRKAAERKAKRIAATTIDMSAAPDPNAIIRVGPENPAALAFEEKMRTHRIVVSEDGKTAKFVPREATEPEAAEA